MWPNHAVQAFNKGSGCFRETVGDNDQEKPHLRSK